MKKYLGVVRVLFLVFTLSLIWGGNLCYAGPPLVPQVTKWRLTNPADAISIDTYLVMPNADELNPLKRALYIKPTQSDSSQNSGEDVIIENAFGLEDDAVQGPSSMFGGSGESFGMMLMSLTTDNIQYLTGVDTVINYTDEFLGGTAVDDVNPDTRFYGPINYHNFSSGLPAGTELEVTVALNGHKPHFIGVLGADADIQYDVAADTILITAKTVIGATAADTENFEGQVITSYFGFCVNSDTELFGTTPLKIIGQTDVWVGDFNLFAPGSDAVSYQGGGSAGTLGSSSALFGFTAWGQTGYTRHASIFIPDDSLAAIFGSGVTPSTSLTGFANNAAVSTTVTAGTNFGVSGQTFAFNYTFASGKDAGVGVTPESTGDSGSLPVGPLAVGVSALLGWWKRRKE
ncbi:MAG: hypothetical protein WC081_03795 [Candidatus Ratteibacteria bacterium]|jgi:hypothetical protein